MVEARVVADRGAQPVGAVEHHPTLAVEGQRRRPGARAEVAHAPVLLESAGCERGTRAVTEPALRVRVDVACRLRDAEDVPAPVRRAHDAVVVHIGARALRREERPPAVAREHRLQHDASSRSSRSA